jgi:hypothetical protein
MVDFAKLSPYPLSDRFIFSRVDPLSERGEIFNGGREAPPLKLLLIIDVICQFLAGEGWMSKSPLFTL